MFALIFSLAISAQPVQPAVCYASPPEDALIACTVEGWCAGSGTVGYATSRWWASYLALRACDDEYDAPCTIDYCEVRR